ncbi:MAG TPA: hypothetical protein VHW09_05185 [Bryobacteraceae bacterium]|jgi:hypothetical protein|nr:hypothetical protein [Bryobacteraceae bacterium]
MPHRCVSWRRAILGIVLFGTAFGYLEAAVVSYLRLLHEPARLRYYPGRDAGELFPLLTLNQLRATGPQQGRLLTAELGREAATIIMLAAVALAVSQNAGQWAAAFVMAFGVWDLWFYVFLKILLGWPASLLTWDILFLIPVPWVGPVLAPALVSAAMIGGGAWHFRSEARGRPVRIGTAEWVGILGGAMVIVFAFAMDYGNLMSGGMPRPFHWTIFGAGLVLGVGSYGVAARRAELRPASERRPFRRL